MAHNKTAILPYPELAFTLPEADAHALTGLSDVSQARAWTQHKAAEYKNHISTLLAIYNSLAPMSTLPTEILQEIFARIPSLATWYNASLWLLSLGLVCRRWHSILLATPEYWARGLHTVMDPSYYMSYRSSNYSDNSNLFEDNAITRGRALFLARSAPWPLEIRLEYSVHGPGWEAFDGHFDRVIVFEVVAHNGDELDNILDTVTSRMKRLEKLRIDADYYRYRLSPLLFDWEAEDLPRLGCLQITSNLFCGVTTVSSLHTVILTAPPRDVRSLPQLFDALAKCPALATLRLGLTHKDNTFQNRVLKRVLNLPNLRTLAVGGGISDVRCFLSGLSFPSATLVELDVIGTGNEQDRGLVLPNLLPRAISGVRRPEILDGVDRLCFYCDQRARHEISMQGYVQGALRLRVSPAFWFRSGGHFLHILTLFRNREVAELALDLRYTPADVNGEFWTKFFAAFPDLHRLELLSPTAASRATKRDIATHYLASCRASRVARETSLVDSLPRTTYPRRAASLAWVLCADERDAALLEAELTDVEQVLRDHANNSGSRVDRLELYVTTPLPPEIYRMQALDVTQVRTDGRASRLVAKEYVSRLQAAAEVVVVGGGWGVAEDDKELGLDARAR